MVSDGDGGAIIAWQDFRAGHYDIYAQRVLPTGQVHPDWPVNGRPLCQSTANQISPVGVSDGAGGAIFVWQDLRSSATAEDIYAQRVLAGGTVDDAWPLDGRALCVTNGMQRFHNVAKDGQGGAIVIWQDERGGVGSDDIYAQRVLGNGTVDPDWPTNGQLVCGGAGAQVAPSIIEDGASGAIASWADAGVVATGSDIYVHHLRSTGEMDGTWPTGGRVVCAADSNQQTPKMVSDGAHGAIITWRDLRPTGPGIYAHHVLASGELDTAWPLAGRAACIAAEGPAFPNIVSDGNGGAIVAWTDFRVSTAAPDIYAQHLFVNGVVDPDWTLNGAAICTASGIQVSPWLVSDTAGGAIVAWFDLRPGSTGDIYAQRVLASGELGGSIVDVPPDLSGSLSLEVVPTPSKAGRLTAHFALPNGADATLQLLDVTGRLLEEQDVRRAGLAHHSIEIRAHLDPGVYFIRLRQSRWVRTSKAIVTN